MLRAFGTGLSACEKRIVHRVIHRKCESIESLRRGEGSLDRWSFAQGAVDETGFTEYLSGTAIRYLGDTQ